MKRTRDIGTRVSLCVNDQRGMDMHRVRAVHVRHDATDALSFIDMESPVVSENDGDRAFPTCYGVADRSGKLSKVRLGRCVFRASDHTPHVGNVHWDEVIMPRREARRLVSHLLTLGWEVTGGPSLSDLYPGGTYPRAASAERAS